MARQAVGDSLGGRMKAAARRAGKTAVRIAEEMGEMGVPVNVVTIRRWWGDRRRPTWENVSAYARAVNTTPEALEGGAATQNRALSERILQVADALMGGAQVSEAVEGVTEPGYLSEEERARLDMATDLFRMALQQALGTGVDWRTASVEERRRAVRLLEALLEQGGSGRRWQ